jgi:hypothetical protein
MVNFLDVIHRPNVFKKRFGDWTLPPILGTEPTAWEPMLGLGAVLGVQSNKRYSKQARQKPHVGTEIKIYIQQHA